MRNEKRRRNTVKSIKKKKLVKNEAEPTETKENL